MRTKWHALVSNIQLERKIMIKLFAAVALAVSLGGCVVAPAPYGYAPAPAYGYYAGPAVDVGIGVGGGYGHGWHGR